MVYFSQSNKDLLQKKLKRAITSVIVVCAVAVAIFVTVLFLATYQSNTWAIVVNSVVLSLAGITTIFVISTVIAPTKCQLALTCKVLSQGAVKVVGKVESVEQNVTIEKHITANVIKLEGNIRKYCCVNAFANGGINVGDKVTFSAVNGYIVECEVDDD